MDTDQNWTESDDYADEDAAERASFRAEEAAELLAEQDGNPRQERIVMSGAAGVAALLSAFAAGVDSAWGMPTLVEAMDEPP